MIHTYTYTGCLVTARRSSKEGTRRVHGAGRLTGSLRSPRVERRVINERTLVSRLGGRA